MPAGQNDYFGIAYWLAMNRPLFYKAVIFVLLFGGASIWGYAGYTGWNLLLDTPRYNKMMEGILAQAVNFKDFKERHAVKSLVITEETAILAGDTRVDAVAKIKNPNAEWSVSSLEYQFVVNGVTGPLEKTWVLPGDERYVATFRMNANIDPKKVDPNKKETLPKAKLTIKKILWKHMKKTELPSYPLFTFSDQNNSTDEFSANIFNATTHSYWSVGVYVIRYGKDASGSSSADQIVGVRYYSVDRVITQQKKEFRFLWPSDPRTTKTVLKGEVDIYDETTILPFDQGNAVQNF